MTLKTRPFVIAVKDRSGEWTTLTAVEARVTQPITVSSDTAGIVTINGGTGGVPAPLRSQLMLADPHGGDAPKFKREGCEHNNECEQHANRGDTHREPPIR